MILIINKNNIIYISKQLKDISNTNMLGYSKHKNSN